MILQHRIQSTGGINTTVDSGVLPETDLVTADNIQFTTSGARLKREGFDYLNTVPTVTHRSSSGTTKTLVFSSTLQTSSPDNEKLVVGEKIDIVTSASSGESTYVTTGATVLSISTTTTTNDTITYTGSGSLTESSTATSTLTVKRAETVIGLHDYWYLDSSNAKIQLLMSMTDNAHLFAIDSSDRRDLVEGQPEVTTVQTVADSGGSLNNTYFYLNSANDQALYYVWFNINSAGTDPSIAGRTGIEITGATGATADTLASAIQSAVDALPDFSASVSTDTVTITNAEAGITTDASDPGSTLFTITVTNQGATSTTTADKARMITFNEKCIISFDEVGSLPINYNPDDSANYQLLGGSPPDFSFAIEHLGRLWVNDKSNPDRLHYSETGNHEVWNGTGDSGALDFTTGDGDNVGIRTAFVYQGQLYVMKGNKYYRVLNSTPETFLIDDKAKGIGAASFSFVEVDDNDVLYISKRGIHAISSTDKFGDTESSFISLKIQQIFNKFPANTLEDIEAVYIPPLNSVAFAVTDRGGTYNNAIYLFNIELKEWYRWPDVEPISLTRRIVNGQFKLVWGDRNGRIIQAQNGEAVDFGSTGIVYRTKSGTIYPANDLDLLKQFHYVKPIYRPTGNFEFTVICKIDNQAPQSVQFKQTASGELWSNFVLGQSVLGINNTLQPYSKTIEGVGRGITIETVNSGSNEQVEIQGWIIGWTPAGNKQEVIES